MEKEFNHGYEKQNCIQYESNSYITTTTTKDEESKEGQAHRQNQKKQWKKYTGMMIIISLQWAFQLSIVAAAKLPQNLVSQSKHFIVAHSYFVWQDFKQQSAGRFSVCGPMDRSLPGSSVRGLSRQEYWSGQPLPSPGIFSTQGSDLGLLPCRRILHHLSQQGSPAFSWAVLHLRVAVNEVTWCRWHSAGREAETAGPRHCQSHVWAWREQRGG